MELKMNSLNSRNITARNITGIVILIALIAGLTATIRWASAGSPGATPGSLTGASVSSLSPPLAGDPSSGHSMEGFSSYEEMMAAHHPNSGQGANPSLATPKKSKGSFQGYNSYEEMMEAHHPKGGQAKEGQAMSGGEDNPGCGGVTNASTEVSSYGLTYNDAGYQELLSDAKRVTLTPDQGKNIVGLNVEIPCCGVKTLQASGNCECGHHVALFGLAKRLALQGYTRDVIQLEIGKWKNVFYPGGIEAKGNTGGC